MSNLISEKQYISKSIFLWIKESLKQKHATCYIKEQLPQMDVKYFLNLVSNDDYLQHQRISIAFNNFKDVPNQEAVRELNNLYENIKISNSFNEASEWRNEIFENPIIIALGYGKDQVTNTLEFFESILSSELSNLLLEERRNKLSPLLYKLFEALTDLGNKHQIKLPVCAKFLSKIDEFDNDQVTILEKINILGCFSDPQLLKTGRRGIDVSLIKKTLIQNFELFENIRTVDDKKLITIKKEINKLKFSSEDYPSKEIFDNYKKDLKEIYDKIIHIRDENIIKPDSFLTFKKVNQLWNLKVEDPDDPDPDEPDEPEDSITNIIVDSLCENDSESLVNISEKVDQFWENIEDTSENVLEIEIEDDSFLINININHDLLKLLDQICNKELFGGIIKSKKDYQIGTIIKNFSDGEIEFFETNINNLIDDPTYSSDEKSIYALIDFFDKKTNNEFNIKETWEKFSDCREKLLTQIKKILFTANYWVYGNNEYLMLIDEYIKFSNNLYKKIHQSKSKVENKSNDVYAKLLQVILSLDILQIETQQEESDEKIQRVILLPIHPLYLWRFKKINEILRLTENQEYDDKDKEIIIKSFDNPEHFLPNLSTNLIPLGKGFDRLFPFSYVHESLPVYEGINNSSDDKEGFSKIIPNIQKFLSLHPFHAFPLRITIKDAPNPTGIILEIVKLMDNPLYRVRQNLSAIEINLISSKNISKKISDSEDLEKIREKIANERLILNTYNESEKFDESKIISHITISFDISDSTMTEHSLQKLKMTPFLVRTSIQPDEFHGSMTLVPEASDGPFESFHNLSDLYNRTSNGKIIHSYSQITTDQIEPIIESLNSESTSTIWHIICDRSLPNDSYLRNQVIRLYSQTAGKRNIQLLTKSMDPIIKNIEKNINEFNFSSEDIKKILRDLSNLVGSGLLEMINQKGGSNKNKIIGNLGLVATYRYLKKIHNDALIFSSDDAIARSWLKMGDIKKRCDLISIRKNKEKYIISAIEIKSTVGGGIDSSTQESAIKQVSDTLEVLKSCFYGNESDPLSIPRLENLKKIVQNHINNRSVKENINKVEKVKLISDLKDLLDNPDSQDIEFNGILSLVPLTEESGDILTEKVTNNENLHEIYTIRNAKNILKANAIDLTVETDRISTNSNEINSPDEEVVNSPVHSNEINSPDEEVVNSPVHSNEINSPDEEVNHLNNFDLNNPSDNPADSTWREEVNDYGLIGNKQLVKYLKKQASFYKKFDMKDNIGLVGGSGLGKTTYVQKFAEDINLPYLGFNGGTMDNIKVFLDRATAEGYMLDDETFGNIVIHIDEAHGLKKPLQTAILSMTDAIAETDIKNKIRSFKNVIFIISTTDPGFFSEAFASRFETQRIIEPTLNELASIVHLHASQFKSDSYEFPITLSQACCLEIAVRNSCHVRKSVNQIKPLVANFYDENQHGDNMSKVSEALTLENVKKYYEDKGIDKNGFGTEHHKILKFLLSRRDSNYTASKAVIMNTLSITNEADFDLLRSYLLRLQLVETKGGQALTQKGIEYAKLLTENNLDNLPDLRSLLQETR